MWRLTRYGTERLTMYLTVKLGDYTLAVLRYADQNEPEGIYVKTMYEGWSRLPLKLTYDYDKDESNAVGMVLEGLPRPVHDYVVVGVRCDSLLHRKWPVEDMAQVRQ